MKLVLRIGHKFAFAHRLRHSLNGIIQEVDHGMSSVLKKLSIQEQCNFKKWKAKILRHITSQQDWKPKVEAKIWSGIKELKNMKLVTKQADKNLGLVAVRGDIYNAFLRQQLKPPTFMEVPTFPHDDIVRRLENTIRTKYSIPEEVKETWINHAKKATDPNDFYLIPKIHKKELGVRPITAQHSYALAPVSKALAAILQMDVETIPTIAKNTTSVLRRIEKTRFSDPFVFVTFDIVSMYPSINLQDAIETLHHHLPKLRYDYEVWGKLLQLIMFNNYVTANGKTYRQLMGTATGTQVAPQFANLYAHYKFKPALEDPTILFLDRFIDDGFMIIKTREDARRIMHALNQLSSLKFTYDISDQQATYLDLIIFKGNRFKDTGILDVKVYFKPCNKLLYLPACSSHPKPMKYGIIIGEAIRTLRNCSSKSDWLAAMHFIFKGLIARGYSPTTLKKHFKKIRFEDRPSYLTENTKKKRPRGFFIKAVYHPNTYLEWTRIKAKFPIHSILVQKHPSKWSTHQKRLLNKWPPMIIWHQFRKIGNYLISAKQQWSYPSLVPKKRPRADNNNNLLTKKPKLRHNI